MTGEAAAPNQASEASEAHGGAVADIVETTPRNSAWRPAELMTRRIVRRRAPLSIDELEPGGGSEQPP